jgi:hypothetical protein
MVKLDWRSLLNLNLNPNDVCELLVASEREYMSVVLISKSQVGTRRGRGFFSSYPFRWNLDGEPSDRDAFVRGPVYICCSAKRGGRLS